MTELLVLMNDAAATDKKIIAWTLNPAQANPATPADVADNVLAVKITKPQRPYPYLVEFRNRPFPGQSAQTPQYPIHEIDDNGNPIPRGAVQGLPLRRLALPVSLETNFDGQALRARPPLAQALAGEWLMAKVILPFLKAQPLLQSAAFLFPQPSVALEPWQLPAEFANAEVQETCLQILDTPAALEAFLQDPAALLGVFLQPFPSLTPDQTAQLHEAFTTDIQSRAAALRHLRDSLELACTPGDHNTYIFIGRQEIAAPHLHQPGLTWLIRQLPVFTELNGYLPSFGGLLTEAQRRQWVVLGPGVTPAEREYLAWSGCQILDRTAGEPIGKITEYLAVLGDEASEQRSL